MCSCHIGWIEATTKESESTGHVPAEFTCACRLDQVKEILNLGLGKHMWTTDFLDASIGLVFPNKYLQHFCKFMVM